MSTNTTTQPLLAPIQMGDLLLSNRMAMAPLTRNRADNPDSAPTDLHVEYYSQRAGAGLIISEGSQVSERGVGYIYTAGIHNAAQIEGWKKVTKAVHNKEGHIFCQLWHVGRISHPDFHNGELPLAPSAINPKAQAYTQNGFTDTVTPKAMSTEEIKTAIDEFRQGAANAIEAGFDGVEIHAANGYLVHQFIAKCANHRTDEYGGSIENRSRFLFELLEAVATEIPLNRVGIRLNPMAHGFSGMSIDEETLPIFEYIVKKLGELTINGASLAYLHIMQPFGDVSEVSHAITNVTQHFRPLFKGILMTNNGFNQASGNAIIAENHADMVAYGKLFIANPDLPKRFEAHAELNRWDSKTFYTQGKEGYTDYPFLK
ncbi:MAG: alkene reductase [Chitinophagales bacterium]